MHYEIKTSPTFDNLSHPLSLSHTHVHIRGSFSSTFATHFWRDMALPKQHHSSNVTSAGTVVTTHGPLPFSSWGSLLFGLTSHLTNVPRQHTRTHTHTRTLDSKPRSHPDRHRGKLRTARPRERVLASRRERETAASKRTHTYLRTQFTAVRGQLLPPFTTGKARRPPLLRFTSVGVERET